MRKINRGAQKAEMVIPNPRPDTDNTGVGSLHISDCIPVYFRTGFFIGRDDNFGKETLFNSKNIG